MTKHGYLKNRKCPAVYQNDAKINCWYQKRYYRNQRPRRVTYAWHGFSESFSHCASQLDQIIRVKLDQKHIPSQENHKPLEKQYEYICRTDANRHRGYRNTRQDISRGHTISTVILSLSNPSHRTATQILHRIRRICNKDKNITHTTNDDLKLVSQTDEELQQYLQKVKPLSNDTHMEVGIDRCAKITLKTKINSFKKFNSLHTST
jgi:hypothetical protein